jgi:hypothetical protein
VVVNQAISQVRELQNEKREIEESNQVGAKTQNAFALLNGTGIWPMLADDIAKAIAASNPQPELLTGDPQEMAQIPAEERRLFWLESLQAEYVPPPGAETPFGGRGGRGGGAAEPAEDAVTDPMLRIYLTVRTTHRDSYNLANSTIAQWLRQNAAREGVPYQHLATGQHFSLATEQIAAGERSTTQVVQTGPRQTRGGREPFGPTRTTQPTGRPRGGQTGTTTRTAQDLMPLSEPPQPAPYAPDGAVIHQCTLSWDVMLKEPETEEEMGGGA